MTAEQWVGIKPICGGCIWQVRNRKGLMALKEEIDASIQFGGEQDLNGPHCRAARVIFNSWPSPELGEPITHDAPSLTNGGEQCNRYWPTYTQIIREIGRFTARVVR
mgnify:FL=1